MRNVSRFGYAVLFLFLLFTCTQAQMDTTRSGNTGSNSGKTGTTDNTGRMDNTGGMGRTDTNRTGNMGNTGGIDNTGSMGRRDTSRTGNMGNTGTMDHTGGMGRTDTSRSGNTGNRGNTGNMGNTGGMGRTDSSNSDVTGGGSRTGTGTDMSSMIRSSIEDASSRFMQAINSGDVNSALQFYTTDATLLPPDLDIIQGSTGIGNFWSKLTNMGMKFDTLTTADVKPSQNGESVDEIGRYFLKIERPGQNAVSEKGKFLLVWKRQPDNTWKIDTHMWNRSRQ